MAWKNAKKDLRRGVLKDMLGHGMETGDILEFGAFASPTFDPDEGDIRYADRLSTDELRMSVNNPEKRAAILPVDFIVDDRFDQQIDQKFDLIVANHVVEHVPDVIGWLNKLAFLLKPEGHIFLSVPDKNFTFDIMRDPSLTREIVDSFLSEKQQPSRADILDARYFRRDIKNGSDVWNGLAHHAIKAGSNINVAHTIELLNKSAAEGTYIDAHCNVFTEASFVQVFKSLAEMGFGDVKLIQTKPVQRPYNEFYALFQKNPDVSAGH